MGLVNIYVSEDGGAFSRLAHGTGPELISQGVTGHGYRFFTQTYDKAGNFEALKNVKEARTEIVGADLIGAWTTEDAKPKGSGAVKFKGKLTVTDQSPNRATTPVGVVRLYLSATETLDASAKVIGADIPFGMLAPGGSVALSVNGGKLPGGSAVAGMYVIAVINPDHEVPETDYTNNTAVYGPLP